MNAKNDSTARVNFISNNFPISDLESENWKEAPDITIDKYWSGEPAPVGRHFGAKLLWSRTALYVRFDANRSEPLVVSTKPNLRSKTPGLWSRDVCEIFVAPDKDAPRKYFEFEIAPNGEWLDLAIDLTSGKRKAAWDFRSGMEAVAKIEEKRVVMAIKVPWKALGEMPKAGDVWLGNLFRCVGKEPDRGYLAWQPTMTQTPDFHEPEAFGEFKFER